MVRLAGYFFSNAGVARDLGASTVGAFTANTADDTTAIGSAIASTETDANGRWEFLTLAEANYDVRIVDGSSIRWVKYSTEIETIRITATNIELGHGTDTTLTRVSAGLIAVEGVTVVDVSTAQTLTNKTFNLTSNTFVATSAQLATAVTDETGTGLLVFATSPTLTTPTVSGLLTVNGNIQFPATQVADAGANVLDDYEEGTFTPGLTFGGGSVSMTFDTTRNGYYTKIGNRLMYSLHFALTAKGSSTGVALVTGLPFNAANVTGNNAPAALFTDTITFADTPYARSGQNGAVLTLFESTNAGVMTQLNETDFAATSALAASGSYQTA